MLAIKNALFYYYHFICCICFLSRVAFHSFGQAKLVEAFILKNTLRKAQCDICFDILTLRVSHSFDISCNNTE